MSPLREKTLTQDILAGFAKHGPWALLAIVILSYMGYQANRLVPVISDYVVQSAKNNQRLVETSDEMQASLIEARQERIEMMQAVKAAVANQEQLMRAMTNITAEHADTGKAVNQNGDLLKEIVKLMDEAKEMMKDVPANREEQLKALHEIQKGIEQLRADIVEKLERQQGDG